MNWILAVGSGAGLGLAYFGGLWLTVRRLVARPSIAALIPLSSLIRLVLLASGLTLLCRQGPGQLVGALGGLWLSRWYLLRRLGGLRP